MKICLNVIGSNIFNLLMVIGASGIIKPLLVEKSILSKEFPFVLLTSIILVILSLDSLLFNSSINIISRMDGIILLILFQRVNHKVDLHQKTC